MWISITLIVVSLSAMILYFLKQLGSQKKYPPGPLRLPIIGSVWRLLINFSQDSFIQLAKQYGNVCMIWAGSLPVVVFSGFEAVKEAAVNHSEYFDERPETPFFKSISRENGIVFTNGHTWKQQRKFGLVTMRKLGLGKKGMEHQIEEEARQLVETFTDTKGQPFDPLLPITNSVTNVINVLTFGQRFSVKDEDFLKLRGALFVFIQFTATFFHLLYDLFPWIMKRLPGPHKKAIAARDFVASFAEKEIQKHKAHGTVHEPQDFIEAAAVVLYDLFPWIMKRLPGPHKKAIAARDFVASFAEKEIQKHKAHGTVHEPQDFIDYYLLQMEKSKRDPTSTYSEENLSQCIAELFAAGTETTTSTLYWALLLMANYPDIQAKVYKEIDNVFGSSQSFSYQDRKKVPYTNAVIHEIQRFRYVFLFGLPRQCSKDVNLFGFFIPKGATVIIDMRSALFDPKKWETPQEFNPNHFLDKDGHFVENKAFLPFGAGARVCLGEQLARIELFIFFTRLLRTFTFQPPEGMKKISGETIVRLVTPPYPYKVCAIPRNNGS